MKLMLESCYPRLTFIPISDFIETKLSDMPCREYPHSDRPNTLQGPIKRLNSITCKYVCPNYTVIRPSRIWVKPGQPCASQIETQAIYNVNGVRNLSSSSILDRDIIHNATRVEITKRSVKKIVIGQANRGIAFIRKIYSLFIYLLYLHSLNFKGR